MSVELINVHVRAEDSDGRVGMIEAVIPAGFGGPPLHVHPAFDDAIYVLGGELTIQVGDEIATRGAGQLAFAPRGTPHTFANLSEREARVLSTFTPAGFERVLERLEAMRVGKPPPEHRPEPETLDVGPPIGG